MDHTKRAHILFVDAHEDNRERFSKLSTSELEIHLANTFYELSAQVFQAPITYDAYVVGADLGAGVSGPEAVKSIKRSNERTQAIKQFAPFALYRSQPYTLDQIIDCTLDPGLDDAELRKALLTLSGQQPTSVERKPARKVTGPKVIYVSSTLDNITYLQEQMDALGYQFTAVQTVRVPDDSALYVQSPGMPPDARLRNVIRLNHEDAYDLRTQARPLATICKIFDGVNTILHQSPPKTLETNKY